MVIKPRVCRSGCPISSQVGTVREPPGAGHREHPVAFYCVQSPGSITQSHLAPPGSCSPLSFPGSLQSVVITTPPIFPVGPSHPRRPQLSVQNPSGPAKVRVFGRSLAASELAHTCSEGRRLAPVPACPLLRGDFRPGELARAGVGTAVLSLAPVSAASSALSAARCVLASPGEGWGGRQWPSVAAGVSCQPSPGS